MNDGQEVGSDEEKITRPGEMISRSVVNEEDQAGVDETAQTNSPHSARETVDQPPFDCGGSIPSLPTEHGNAEETSESGKDPDLGRGGQAPAPLVRSANLLTLEDRLLVALARRGALGMWQFLSLAAPEGFASEVSDRQFVSACEDYANALDPERAA